MKVTLCAALLALVLAGPLSAQELPISQVRFVGGPDISTFAQTTSVTQVDVQSGGTELAFDKKTGPNRWPDNMTPGWTGTLQYSIGMCENINSEWICSAPIEVWYGRLLATGPIQDQSIKCAVGTGQIHCNWFYRDQWAPLNGHQPQPGEQVGMFVVAGDARNNFNPVRERSNIVLLNLPAEGQTQTFNYTVVVPQPTPVPAPTPVPVPVPTPVPMPQPLPSDQTSLLMQIASQAAACNAAVAASRLENQAFFTGVKSTWDSVSPVIMPLVKYVVPAITAYLAGKGKL